MKLSVLTTSYPRSDDDDSSIFLHRLYRAMSADFEITIFAPSESSNGSSDLREGIPVMWFTFLPFGRTKILYGAGLLQNLKRSPWRIIELPFLVLKFAKVAKQTDATGVIHANWILPGIGAWIAKIFGGPKYIITLRGSDAMLFKHPLIRALSFPALQAAAAVTTVSRELQSSVQRYFPLLTPKLTCIENGVELGAQTDLQVELPSNYLVMVGSVIPRKRIELGIELIASTLLQHYSLVVAGKIADQEYYADLKRLTKRLEVTERVIFLDALAPRHIPTLLARSSAFIAASAFEGRPNAVLEAMLAGKVVLASDIPAHEELITDGSNGILFSERTVSAAASELAKVLSSQESPSALGEAAKASVQSLSWSGAATKYAELFLRVSTRTKQ